MFTHYVVFFPAESGPSQQMTQIYADGNHNDLEVDTNMSASDGKTGTITTAATAATAAASVTAPTAHTDSRVRCPCGVFP